MRRILWIFLLAIGAIIFATPASSQIVVGQCFDGSRHLTINFRKDGYMFVPGTPMQGMTRRDPSGQTFIILPAAIPWQQAFLVGWNGQFIEVTAAGANQIGTCAFAPDVIPPPPSTIWQPPVPSATMGVYDGAQFVPLPETLAATVQANPFAPPLLTTEARATACWAESGADREQFGTCMVRTMIGDRERAAYDCIRADASRTAAATCIVGALGGPNERAVARAIAACQERFGTEYEQYPLCMASQAVPGGSDIGRLVNCVQQQQTSGNVDMLGTAICYGADKLDLNAEAQIAVQCAATTGGEPYAFAACAGGQLTVRELDKCFTNGIGGSSGCFGPNNTIVQAIGVIGQTLGAQFGPNNDIVRTWNTAYRDIIHGPGPNNEVRTALRNVGNEVGRTFGPNNDIRKAVERVVPRIRIKW